MSARTESEVLFERWCEQVGATAIRVEEASTKRPDYEVLFDNYRVIAEVTQIERNPEELESDRQLALRGYGNATGGTPGARVRSKITGCAAQVKARTEGKHPSMLVIYADFMGITHLGSYHVMTAMYGLEVAHIVVPRHYDAGQQSRITGWSLGPKKKMTASTNTSISAVVTFCLLGEHGTPTLTAYHNDFAAIPLHPDVLRPAGVTQFRGGSTHNWERA